MDRPAQWLLGRERDGDSIGISDVVGTQGKGQGIISLHTYSPIKPSPPEMHLKERKKIGAEEMKTKKIQLLCTQITKHIIMI